MYVAPGGRAFGLRSRCVAESVQPEPEDTHRGAVPIVSIIDLNVSIRQQRRAYRLLSRLPYPHTVIPEIDAYVYSGFFRHPCGPSASCWERPMV